MEVDVTASVCTKLASIIDRLAHPATNDLDALQTVAGLRRILKGDMPSRILRIDADTRNLPHNKQVATLRRKVSELRTEKEKLEREHSALQLEHSKVKDQLNQLLSEQPKDHKPDRDSYSYHEVMEIIRSKFGKQNGGFTLWADFSAKLHRENPDTRVLTTSKLQTWRTARAFPAWAVNQLLAMPVGQRVTHRWSDEDIDFLVRIHLADPLKTDEDLAMECSRAFGCEIGVNSIKGKFNMLRKQGRIPLLRPGRQ